MIHQIKKKNSKCHKTPVQKKVENCQSLAHQFLHPLYFPKISKFSVSHSQISHLFLLWEFIIYLKKRSFSFFNN
jgi:hypothetical protein